MTDWVKIQSILDDQTTRHKCAICGKNIPQGDKERWGIAVRALEGQVSVAWAHGPCFVGVLQPSIRRAFTTAMPSGLSPA